MALTPDATREVVVFHSALGMRRGIVQWAAQLRSAGHRVHTPDLNGGRVFDDKRLAGRALERSGGLETLLQRADAAIATVPNEVVYAGFSIGAEVAQTLARRRPGAQGAILMHGVLSASRTAEAAWPPTVPVQVHFTVQDPYRDEAGLGELERQVRRSGAGFELWNYPGSRHLFTDRGTADFRPRMASLLNRRVMRFLHHRTGS